MKATLLKRLNARGFQARIVSIGRLRELREAFEQPHRQNLLDEGFYQARLSEFRFSAPADMPAATSVIVVAFSDPQVRFIFHWRGTPVHVIVPPTYLHWIDKDRRVERALAESLTPRGYRVAPATLPKKLLAACSGLSAYGRNNITYVEGLGSLHRLAAFYSDLPCEKDAWPGPRVLERCAECSACVRACPTGAIDGERFLIHAERCITLWNEEPPLVAFPEWMERSWHNSLVGCMRCQAVCPENRDAVGHFLEGATFSQEETRMLYAGTPLAEMPGTLVEKLRHWDLMEVAELFPRNLGVLLGPGTP